MRSAVKLEPAAGMQRSASATPMTALALGMNIHTLCTPPAMLNLQLQPLGGDDATEIATTPRHLGLGRSVEGFERRVGALRIVMEERQLAHSRGESQAHRIGD